jgi:hypothetical protein
MEAERWAKYLLLKNLHNGELRNLYASASY